MAQQTSTLTVKGKLGNVVGYKNRGKNLARIRVESIKNPNTTGQAIQRMITATNARAYSRLKRVCDHSFEGVSYGQMSMDYFLKQNAKLIREFVAATWPEFPADMDVNSYVGLSGVDDFNATGVGLLISKGSLPEISVDRGRDGELIGFGNVLPENATVRDFFAALGAQVGDQISIVALDALGSVHLTRYVTNPDADAQVLGKAFSEQYLRDVCLPSSIFNEKALIASADNRILVTGASIPGAAYPYLGLAIILSRKQADGSFLRSTQRLVWAGDADTGDLATAATVIPEWEAGKVVIDTDSPYFLNQPRTALSD